MSCQCLLLYLIFMISASFQHPEYLSLFFSRYRIGAFGSNVCNILRIPVGSDLSTVRLNTHSLLPKYLFAKLIIVLFCSQSNKGVSLKLLIYFGIVKLYSNRFKLISKVTIVIIASITTEKVDVKYNVKKSNHK